MTVIGQILRLARLTFLEAVRQRFFVFVLILSLALIGCATFFGNFNFGASELKFIADFGLGAIFFFGSILSVVAMAQLFFSEIENRTALTILAKPLRRWAFLAGKFGGVMLVLLVFVGFLTALLSAYLAWRQGQLIKVLGSDFPDSQRVQFDGLVIYALLQWIKFGVLASITLLIASFSNTNLFTVVVAFFAQLICQLQYIARDSWQRVENPAVQTLVWLLGKVFPNFQVFNLGELVIFPLKNPISSLDLASAGGYGVIYIMVFLALAVFSFRTREI
jgi:ABC-type transport system involved in multi-copper enzyme maturation permease subunit